MEPRLPEGNVVSTAENQEQRYCDEAFHLRQERHTSSSHDGSTTEPIAMVGFAVKYPQEATSAETFWQMLSEGRNATTDFPPDRLNIDAFYNPDASKRSTVCGLQGEFKVYG